MGILPSDLFHRSAVYPNITKSGHYDDAALLTFSKLNEDETQKAISLAGWDKCLSIESVHDFGLCLEDTKNKRTEEKLQRPLDQSEVHHYLGYYNFNARDFNFSCTQYSKVILRHAPEDGDDRHYQIEIIAKNDQITKKQVKSDERIARMLLSRIIFGPERLPEDQCCSRKLELQRDYLPVRTTY